MNKYRVFMRELVDKYTVTTVVMAESKQDALRIANDENFCFNAYKAEEVEE